MAANTIRLYVTADGKVAVRTFGEVGTASTKAADTVEKDSKRESDSFRMVGEHAERMRGMVAGLAGTIGLGGLAFGIKDVITAGMRLQQQQTQLQGALKATGDYSARTYAMITRSADALSEHGGFAVPEQLAAMTKFVGQTHSATEAMKMNAAATDVARRLNKGYADASTLVGRAMTGTAGRLQQYLGIIQPVKTAEFALSQAHKTNVFQLEAQSKALGKLGPAWLKQQEALHNMTPAMVQHAQLLDKQATATEALSKIQRTFAGATSAYNRGAAGSISDLKNSFDNLAAHLGTKLLPIITAVVKWMDKNKTAVLVLMGVLGSLGVVIGGVSLATKAWAAMQTIAKVATVAVGAAVDFLTPSAWGLSAAMDVLAVSSAAAWVAMTLGVALVIAAIVLIITHFKQFKEIVAAIWNWLKTAATNAAKWIAQAFATVFHVLSWPFVEAWKIIGKVWHWVEGAVSDAAKFIGHAFSTVFHVISWPFVEAWKIISGIFSKIKGAVKGIIGIPGKIAGAVGHFITHPFGLHTGGIVPHMASGGVLGGYGGGDVVPAWLEPGEGVVRKESVAAMGSGQFNAINSGAMLAGPGPGGGGAGNGEYLVAQPFKISLGPRVIAEGVNHFVAKKSAMAGHYVSG